MELGIKIKLTQLEATIMKLQKSCLPLQADIYLNSQVLLVFLRLKIVRDYKTENKVTSYLR